MKTYRQPWPMKWIALAIVLVIVPYTFITLRYRKPGKPFEPAADMKNRANVARLLAAGYQRIPLPAELPADPLRGATSATIQPAGGGLPAGLRATLVDTPLLPSAITIVSAPPTVSALQPYSFRFACTLPDQQRQPAGADLYLKDNELIVAPDYEKLSGELRARTHDNVIQVTVPAGTLKAGRYRATIIGTQSSRAWSFEVR